MPYRLQGKFSNRQLLWALSGLMAAVGVFLVFSSFAAVNYSDAKDQIVLQLERNHAHKINPKELAAAELPEFVLYGDGNAYCTATNSQSPSKQFSVTTKQLTRTEVSSLLNEIDTNGFRKLNDTYNTEKYKIKEKADVITLNLSDGFKEVTVYRDGGPRPDPFKAAENSIKKACDGITQTYQPKSIGLRALKTRADASSKGKSIKYWDYTVPFPKMNLSSNYGITRYSASEAQKVLRIFGTDTNDFVAGTDSVYEMAVNYELPPAKPFPHKMARAPKDAAYAASPVSFLFFYASDQAQDTNGSTHLANDATSAQNWYAGQVGKSYTVTPASAFRGAQPASYYQTCHHPGGCDGVLQAVYYNIYDELSPASSTNVVLQWDPGDPNYCGWGGGNLAVSPSYSTAICQGNSGRFHDQVIMHEQGHTFELAHSADNTLMTPGVDCGGFSCTLNRDQSADLNTSSRYFNSVSTDNQAPTAPGTVRSGGETTENTISLAWDAASDNTGVAGYKIYRNGNEIANTAVNSFTDSGLTPDTSYAYAAAAYDTSNNLSERSAPSYLKTKPSTVAQPSATLARVTASADTYVDETSGTGDTATCSQSPNACNVDKNFGLSASMTVENTPGAHKYAYIRFPELAGARSIASAKLRLYFPDKGGKQTLYYDLVGNDWSETSINWSNRDQQAPVIANGPGQALLLESGWQTFDVTGYALSNPHGFSLRLRLGEIGISGSTDTPGPRIFNSHEVTGLLTAPAIDVAYRSSTFYYTTGDSFTDQTLNNQNFNAVPQLVGDSSCNVTPCTTIPTGRRYIWSQFGAVNGGANGGRLWIYLSQTPTTLFNGFYVSAYRNAFSDNFNEAFLTWQNQPPGDGVGVIDSFQDLFGQGFLPPMWALKNGWVAIDLNSKLGTSAGSNLALRVFPVIGPISADARELFQTSGIDHRMRLEVFN